MIKKDTFTEPIEEIPVAKYNNYLTDKTNKIFHSLLMDHNLHSYNEKIMMIILLI